MASFSRVDIAVDVTSKSIKWHFKTCCFKNTDTGYLSNFAMYSGNNERRPADMPATLYPMQLKTQKNVDGNYNNMRHYNNIYNRCRNITL